jgi:hypothetical protein
MNVVKILLILGLGYFALTQKSEKTKNMLLVVTGLLAFCMFSLEGFTIAEGDNISGIFLNTTGTTLSAATANAPLVVAGSANRYTFSGTDTITLDGSTPIPSTVTCKTGTTGDTVGNVGYQSNKTWTSAPTSSQIDEWLTCETAVTAPSNGEQRVGGSDADPCNCLTAVDGKNLYCNSGWMNSEILDYMDSDGKKTDNYEDAHKCWSGTLDFIPKLGDSFLGRCTKKAGSGDCTAPPAA